MPAKGANSLEQTDLTLRGGSKASPRKAGGYEGEVAIDALQLGELPALRGMVGKLIVGEDHSWNNV